MLVKRLTNRFLMSSRATSKFFKFCSVGGVHNFSLARISHGICLSNQMQLPVTGLARYPLHSQYYTTKAAPNALLLNH